LQQSLTPKAYTSTHMKETDFQTPTWNAACMWPDVSILENKQSSSIFRSTNSFPQTSRNSARCVFKFLFP